MIDDVKVKEFNGKGENGNEKKGRKEKKRGK